MSLADAIRVLNQKVPPVHLPENPREPLQPSKHGGFPEVPPVHPGKTKDQAVTHALADDDQPAHDIEPANNRQPFTVEAWTPAGILMLVEASSVEHAQWIERMNPPPIPARAVRCCDCKHASVTAGIARCAVGVESGLPIAGFWATDRHLCARYEAKP